MKNTPRLIVMLTHDDRTVENAYEIFDQCKNSKAEYWGFKEKGLPLKEMKRLYSYMKECGKTTVLEVVAYTEPECLQGAEMAAECGCDILMGTLFFDSVNAYCAEHKIRYMPFVGKVTGRPSVLDGTTDEMINEANAYIKKGVYGVDLLGYRHKTNAEELIKSLTAQVEASVCIAGSIDRYSRLDSVRDAGAWAFTIGSAFFEGSFEGSFAEQIDKVCAYMEGIR